MGGQTEIHEELELLHFPDMFFSTHHGARIYDIGTANGHLPDDGTERRQQMEVPRPGEGVVLEVGNTLKLCDARFCRLCRQTRLFSLHC